MTEQTPREIAFKDIKKGDDIEARYTRDGVALTRRGVAHSTNSYAEFWHTEASGLVANNYNGDWKYYLHSRPAPEEPKGLGARILLRRGWEYIATNSTPGTHRWVWVREDRSGGCLASRWSDLDPDTIEVLSEGIEVES